MAEALQLIERAQSERALQIGGEKLKKGILNIGVGIIQLLLTKLTMRNLAKARVQVLENVTPKPAALPQPSLPAASDALGTTAKQASQLPALPTSAEKVSIILNKSAVNAMENIAEMAILQSEKVALQEMVTANKLPGNKQVSYIEDLPVKGPKYNPCPDPSPYAKNAVEIIENNNQFVWNEPEAKWLSPDGSRKIWYDNGWKYQDGKKEIVKEFSVYDKYSMVQGITPTLKGTNKSFMNGHHGIQSKWAEENLGAYYNKKQAPAILLRDTCKDTPHQTLTALQTQRKKTGSYFEQREYFKTDCKTLGIPDEIRDLYLQKSDLYFHSIYNKMLSDENLSKTEVDSIFEFNLIKN